MTISCGLYVIDNDQMYYRSRAQMWERWSRKQQVRRSHYSLLKSQNGMHKYPLLTDWRFQNFDSFSAQIIACFHLTTLVLSSLDWSWSWHQVTHPHPHFFYLRLQVLLAARSRNRTLKRSPLGFWDDQCGSHIRIHTAMISVSRPACCSMMFLVLMQQAIAFAACIHNKRMCVHWCAAETATRRQGWPQRTRFALARSTFWDYWSRSFLGWRDSRVSCSGLIFRRSNSPTFATNTSKSCTAHHAWLFWLSVARSRREGLHARDPCGLAWGHQPRRSPRPLQSRWETCGAGATLESTAWVSITVVCKLTLSSHWMCVIQLQTWTFSMTGKTRHCISHMRKITDLW